MFSELVRLRPPTHQESIVDHVTSVALPDADRVVAYLNSGHPLIDMMDLENDLFDPTRQIMNGSSVLTDGDWLWRKDFAHYVLRHNVIVPDDFLALIRERHYIVPPPDEVVLEQRSREAEWLTFY